MMVPQNMHEKTPSTRSELQVPLNNQFKGGFFFAETLRYSFFSQESISLTDLHGTIFHCKSNEKTAQVVKNRLFFGGKCGRILRFFVGS